MKSEKEISKRSMIGKIRSIVGTIAQPVVLSLVLFIIFKSLIEPDASQMYFIVFAAFSIIVIIGFLIIKIKIDKIRSIVNTIGQSVLLILVLFIIFKSLIEPDASQMYFIVFAAFSILLVIGFLFIKINPELSLKMRKSVETIFIYISYIFIITSYLFLFALILQSLGVRGLFTTELLSAFVPIFLFWVAFSFCYITFGVMVTYFAEDAEYFFNEGCDALSKIEHEYKKPDDLLTFLFFYKKGFKKINGKLGKQLSLSNIKFKADDIGVLESIYKKLPYYLLYGKNEQFERTKCHIDAIRQSLRKSNELNGVSIIDEICKFLIEINNHIGEKEILPYKKSFLAEFIREHREWIIPSIMPVIVLIASYFVPGVLDTIKRFLGL